MRGQLIYFLVLVLAIYPISLFLAISLNLAPLANIFGFLALVSYTATLLPSMLRVVIPSIKQNKILVWLLKNRRAIGVTAFALGLNHGVLLIIKRNLDLLDWQTYARYFQGFAILFILTLMAITSNDETVKTLKTNWKKLHRLTYLVIFSLPWHILHKMSGHWTYLTPIAISLTAVIVISFVRRKYLETLSTASDK